MVVLGLEASSFLFFLWPCFLHPKENCHFSQLSSSSAGHQRSETVAKGQQQSGLATWTKERSDVFSSIRVGLQDQATESKPLASKQVPYPTQPSLLVHRKTKHGGKLENHNNTVYNQYYRLSILPRNLLGFPFFSRTGGL